MSRGETRFWLFVVVVLLAAMVIHLGALRPGGQLKAVCQDGNTAVWEQGGRAFAVVPGPC